MTFGSRVTPPPGLIRSVAEGLVAGGWTVVWSLKDADASHLPPGEQGELTPTPMCPLPHVGQAEATRLVVGVASPFMFSLYEMYLVRGHPVSFTVRSLLVFFGLIAAALASGRFFVRPWLPQAAALAHPHIKAAVS